MKSQKKAQKSREIEQKRIARLAEFEALDPAALAFIKESLEAVQICGLCNGHDINLKNDKGELFWPDKPRDTNGLCLRCHGLRVVPDVKRREWAAEQVKNRTSPMPKASEITIDDQRDLDELEEALTKTDESKLDALWKELTGE